MSKGSGAEAHNTEENHFKDVLREFGLTANDAGSCDEAHERLATAEEVKALDSDGEEADDALKSFAATAFSATAFAEIVAPLDNDKSVTWTQGPRARSKEAHSKSGPLATFRRESFHIRAVGEKEGFWIRPYAFEDVEGKACDRKTPLRDGFAGYCDFDSEWFDEALQFAARLSAAGIDLDLAPTGSWGATEMSVDASAVHKLEGLLNDKKKSLKGSEATAKPESVVEAWRRLKPWHPDFSASAQCVLDENGAPKKTMTTIHFSKDTKIDAWRYHVSVKPRRPMRLWWYWDKPVSAKDEARFKRNVARLLHAYGAPPYDKCVFTLGQPVYTNRGAMCPSAEDFKNLPDGLTYHHGVIEGKKAKYGTAKSQKVISYVSSSGSGAVIFDALDGLPDAPDEVTEKKRDEGSKTQKGTFVAESEADEIAHALMTNKAARRGFLAGDVLERIVDDSDRNGDLVVADCYHDDHNAAGRRQMYAKNAVPGTHGAMFGCLDDNCTDHNGGDTFEVRVTRLLSCALYAGVIDVGELPDFFADAVSKKAVKRILAERAPGVGAEDSGTHTGPYFSEETLKKVEAFNGAGFAVVNLNGNTRIMCPSDNPRDLLTFGSVDAVSKFYANDQVFFEDSWTSVVTAWMKWPGRRTYKNVVMNPYGLGAMDSTPTHVLNLFCGWAVEPKAGDCSKFLWRIEHIICGGDRKKFEWVISWCENLVKEPQYKTGTVLVLRGKKGCGKTTLLLVLLALLHHANRILLDKSEQLVGKFNSHIATSVLIGAEEAFFGGVKQIVGALNNLITSEMLAVEKKGIDIVMVENHAHILMATNEDWAVPATEDERRYLVLDVADTYAEDAKNPETADYFNALYAETVPSRKNPNPSGLAAFAQYLLDWQKPDWVDLRRPPITEGLREQIDHGLPRHVKWMQEVLERDNGLKVGDQNMQLSDEGTQEGPQRSDTVVRGLVSAFADQGEHAAITTCVVRDEILDGVRMTHVCLVDDVYDHYLAYAKLKGDRYPVSRKKLGKMLGRLGFERKRSYAGGVRVSIYLTPPKKDVASAFEKTYRVLLDYDREEDDSE